MSQNRPRRKPTLGLALGSGSARGWAHIGVIRALKEAGFEPDVVAGTSIGSLVGGAYVSGELDKLEEWIMTLDMREIIRHLDVVLPTDGGLLEGNKLMEFFRNRLGNGDWNIEELDKAFASVATELDTGREVWFKEGSLSDAIRASIALPGIFTPVRHQGRWLVDGGLSNPVPVSVCRALGADIVIAVNLNGDIVGKHLHHHETTEHQSDFSDTVLGRISSELKARANSVVSQLFSPKDHVPGLFDVIASSLNIMQDKITRSRMAGDPPEILLSPRLAHIGLMEFDRAEEAIKEGHRAANRVLDDLKELTSQYRQ